MKGFTLLEIVVGGLIVVILTALFWGLWYEATFDYTKCQTTEQYRERHSPAWVQYVKSGDIQVPIHHPARDWTERLYKCPDKKGQHFDKWRNEDKP